MVAASLRRRLTWRGQGGPWASVLRVAAALVVLLGIAASAWIARGWDTAVARQRDERLDRTAASRTATIGNALRHYEDALHAERSLWQASTFVSRDDFKVFARTLDLPHRYPGLQRISWRAFVPDEQADAFIAGARRDGAPDFTIRPPGGRPAYYVTLYSELASRYGSTIGLDARATPSILAALEQARDSGQTTMSGQTTLAIDLGMPPAERPIAFELFVPVYRDQAPVATVAQRRAAFRGWACGQFRAADLLKAAMRSMQLTTGVELYDPAVGGEPIASFPDGFRAGGPDVRTDEVTLGGRTFKLRHAPLPGNPALTEHTIPASLLLGTGIALSVLLGTLLWLLAQVSSLYQRVGRMARTDALTGVLNRRVLDQELPRELARAARTGQPLCVALIDLDRFKAYNDQHGHQAGDRLLKAAGAAWWANLRRTDLLVRYGGEEFAVVLPDCGLDDAMAIAERLRTAQPEGTCSIGVAEWVPDETVDELIGRADQALYAAKDGGRDRCCASPSPPASRRRILEGSTGPSGLEAR
jgi:diguanylate cyclase (GGDEF)-like protein